VRVPNPFRVDDNHWTIAALVETSGFIDTNLLLEPKTVDLLAQGIADITGTFVWTSFAADTNEYVFFEYFHICHRVQRSVAVRRAAYVCPILGYFAFIYVQIALRSYRWFSRAN
jgi:hypothetical protein